MSDRQNIERRTVFTHSLTHSWCVCVCVFFSCKSCNSTSEQFKRKASAEKGLYESMGSSTSHSHPKAEKSKKGYVETFRNRRHNTNACVISVHVREETLGHRLEGKYLFS